MPITSPNNDKLKTIRKLRARHRERELTGLFVAEGEDLLSAADAAGWQPQERFAVTGSGLPGTEVEPEALASVSELASGTRTLAIYAQAFAAAPLGRRLIYLDGVGDPGNVGTVIRSAAAFRASCVVLGPGSADPYGPKAVRASMGAIFSMPVVRADRDQLPGTTIALDAAPNLPLLSTVLAGLDVDAENRESAVSLLIGAERDGLSPEVIAACDYAARIPIATESLNAAMAATIALYELNRTGTA